jgi:sigma-B regulation protein RsbU (phosphoserine phosphatase)
VSGVRSLEPGGLVLGLFAHATYRPDSLQLDPGDLVIVCSDGVTEARNASDEEFGRDRLIACVESSGAFRPGSVRWASVESSHGLDPETLVEHLLQDVRDFTAGEQQADDLTALVLRYRGLQ